MTNVLNGLPVSPKQARSIARANARVNLWHGSIRSGKTFASTLRWLTFLANPPRGGQLVMVGRTRDSVARNVIDPLQDPDIYGPQIADQVKYTSGAPFANILGHRVYVLGASDSKAEKTIRGLTLAGAYVDEATVLHEEFFTQLTGRMSVPKAQLFATTNPDSPAHWLKKKYIDKIGPDPAKGQLHNWKLWHFNIDDNPVLTESYKTSIKNEFSGLFYKRFILGEWVAAEGAVYDMWNPEQHVVHDDEMPPIQQYLSIGIDYGTTNPTAAILLGLGEDGRLYAVDEWRYTPNAAEVRKTDAQLSAEINQWREYNHITDVPVIVDPAAASFRVQMQQDRVRTTAANNDVLYGIRTITSLLATDRLKINARCTALIDEFPGYVWDSKATEKGEDQVIKANDHCIREGELITTRRGDVPIERVTTDDEVLTRAGYKRVLKAWQTSPSADVLTLTTANGKRVTATGNHKIWTENRGWVRMDALRYGDILTTCQELKPLYSTGSHTVDTPTRADAQTESTTPQTAANEAVEGADSTRKSGSTTTGGKYPTATTFTMWTETQTTTRPKTSNSLPETNTGTTTPSNTPMTQNGANIGNVGKNQDSAPREHGTQRERANNGTPNTQNNRGQNARPSREYANIAEQPTKQNQPTVKTVSVVPNAEQHGAENQGSTTKNARASIAEINSPLTSTAKPELAVDSVLNVYAETAKAAVYDLTVEDQHEFFAGGILVHNCLDALRYAIVTTERRWRRTIDLTV